MFDKLYYDRAKYPTTGFLARLLCGTHSCFQWSLEFFGFARREVEAGRMNERGCFDMFRDYVLRSSPKEGFTRVDPQRVDWPTLFNFVEEATRPTEAMHSAPNIILRAPGTASKNNSIPEDN
jgi:hypothetical protein